MINLSIIIPTYNRAPLIKRCLESVVEEDGDFEIIVVDDGSVDDTEKIVKAFGDNRIVYVKQPCNLGVNSARNRAIATSLRDWVFCLDDDDELIPGSIKIITERISQMPPGYNVAYFNSKIVRDEHVFVGGFQFVSEESFFDPSYSDTMFKFNLKGDCKPAFRRSLFVDARYNFPETVNGFESYTMNLIARDNKGIRYWKDVVTLVHQEKVLTDRLSIGASKKKPLPLLILHIRQVLQHFRFYSSHPIFFYNKSRQMFKLFVRTVCSSFGINW